jgi:hypothetical protein
MKIIKSWRKNKKLAILTPSGWIHFGDTRYKDYTQHKDKARRAAYLQRASKIKDKAGRLTINNPKSANYYAARILWNYKPKNK